jgi:hypothetical protein
MRKFLNYVVAGLLISSFSILVQAETIEAAAATNKIIKAGDVLQVTYTLDAKNLAVTCDYVGFVSHHVSWLNKGVQQKDTLDVTLTANATFRQKHFNSSWADAKGTIFIENASASKPMTVTCNYLLS